MNKPIGAIQTHYAGRVFRSRLEARWAVFFDALNVEWKYEDQGYEVAGKRYLPDFFIPSINAWCEVKGDPKGLKNDFQCMKEILGANSPLPGLVDGTSFFIMLGDVPRFELGTFCHPLLKHGDQGIQRDWCFFLPRVAGGVTLCKTSGTHLEYLLGLSSEGHLEMDANDQGWLVETRFVPTKMASQKMADAYKSASTARFEHGESGGFVHD